MESFWGLHCMETEDCEQNKDEICSIYHISSTFKNETITSLYRKEKKMPQLKKKK
jgi:hypothetical protein